MEKSQGKEKTLKMKDGDEKNNETQKEGKPEFKEPSVDRSDSSETSSDEGSTFRPRQQSWNVIPTYRKYHGEWDVEGGEMGYPTPCKSETEETPSSEDKERSEGDSGASSSALSNVYAKLSPFNAKWSFGINCQTGLINLTTAKNFEVLYVSSHFGVIYNYRTNTMTFLPGHNYAITSIAADASGRWLVTADAGEDTVIIIWDYSKQIPVWSLYNVFPTGVRHAAISQDARFLAAISYNFPYSMKFWLWTYGREKPDAEMDIDDSCGHAQHIDFNHIKREQFAVTTDSKVIFCEWKNKTKTIDTFTAEAEFGKKKMGTLRESLFLDDNHSVITSTTQGYVVVWTDNENVCEEALRTKPGSIQKLFFKTLRLHNAAITSIKLIDGVIVSSSEEGTILFHDQHLCLLYWQMKMKIDPVAAISFNIDYISQDSDPFSQRFHTVGEESMDEEVEKVFEYEPSQTAVARKASKTGRSPSRMSQHEGGDHSGPTDCTLDMRPFNSRDYIFLTTTGKLGYVSHRRRKIKYYLYGAGAPVMAMDCSPTKAHLIVGDSLGRLVLYEYVLKKILLATKFQNGITMLKYSRLGHCIMAGFQNGELFELDPLLLHVKFKFDSSKAKIEKLCFSYTDDLVAFYDQTSTVQVFMKKASSNLWICMGRYISHYKPIVDIMFEDRPESPKGNRLFTIGQDRMLVEYDVKNLEENNLKILSMVRIEQTAVPWCFTWLYDFYKTPHFLISNDQYKLKVYDAQNCICQKTTLGPTADTPIKFMRVIVDEKSSLIYHTEKHIGIRLLPPTGNPFEGMGMIGHPEKVVAFTLAHDHKYVFTSGVNDSCVLMWEVNAGCVEVASQLGGTGLEPFVSLIEGGPNSFLFREIEDFFYYAQIIHQGEDPNVDRSVSRLLALCEIPDLFRALGFYPTDYEVENLLHELKHQNHETSGQYISEITFDECVKAYLNHRPVHGITIDHINKALLAIADLSDPSDIIVEREELYKALEDRAEAMDHAEAVGYLCILLLPKDEKNPVPPAVSLKDFTQHVLGIDLSVTEENVREITHAFQNKTA